jgi:uncharacterized membrane protein
MSGRLVLRVGLGLLGLVVGLSVGAQETLPARQGELAWEVYRIFQRHCAECHGGHRTKPKGNFGQILDLERVSGNPKYLVPGDPDESEIYLLMTDSDPSFLMPPPDSDTPPVSTADLALVRAWIEGGAGLGLDAAVAAVRSSGEQTLERPSSTRLASWLGGQHPLLVHFPVALLLAALGADLCGLREARRWCLWIGALGALASVGSGWLWAGVEGYRPDTVSLHRWLGVATAGLATASVVALEVARRGRDRRGDLIVRLLMLLTAFLVIFAGHSGGELVHGG